MSVSVANADLTGADLRDAALDGADLRGADLTGADLRGATLTGARLSGVVWAHTTCPDGADSDKVGRTCIGHFSRE